MSLSFWENFNLKYPRSYFLLLESKSLLKRSKIRRKKNFEGQLIDSQDYHHKI